MDDDINFDLQFDDEEDDCILVEAIEASVTDNQTSRDPYVHHSHDEHIHEEDEHEGNISIGCDQVNENTGPQDDLSDFDRNAGQLWIYPTNYPIRDYQYNIVQQALFRNTLVVLPTGLGKTFIAAVVMYNLYRWFPQGKVIFMAPTKPLVAQQIHACYNIMGIPKIDTLEMTGNMHPNIREKAWRQKRVMFLTPQVMTNDLSRGSCAAKSIKCVVVDEAHKALGNHAYCQVIRELVNFTAEFRVLALSATPGSDLKAVQQVMANLLISHIEMRSEDSIDIRPYTHERKVEKIVVPMGEELSGIRLKYIQIMQMVIQRLIRQRVLYNREATKLSKFLILKARDEYRQNPPQNLQPAQYGMIEADFALAMSIYHGFELLQLHGLRSLYNFLMGIKTGEKGYGRTRYELTRCSEFNDIMEDLSSKFSIPNNFGNMSDEGKKVVVGHPKMQRLEEVVVAHFKSFQEKNLDTRVMIFSQYRDSVEEIRSILNQHHPLVKVMTFIGQSSNGKITKGFTQKEQLRVMRQFREGGFNTLVSTCVGEEGLDIGDVDLIVCFDAHKSPIRLVQRMGRTGRKREGRIVMLVTEGKEEQIYNQSLYFKKSIHKAILNGARNLQFYAHSPRLIPLGITPRCHKMYITVKQDVKKSGKSPSANKSASKEKRKSSEKIARISDLFSKQVVSKRSDLDVSREEYNEIKEEFSRMFVEAKHLPQTKCLMLNQKEEAEISSDVLGSDQMIDLSEWMPWQNRLQQTHLVGHSLQSVHLVKDTEFIELQQSIGESGNAYGLEMDLYLNEEDIIRNNVNNDGNKTITGQESIRSFLIPSQKQSEVHQSSYLQSHHDKVSVRRKSSNASAKIKQSSKGKNTNSSSLFTHIKDHVMAEEDHIIEVNEGGKNEGENESGRVDSKSKAKPPPKKSKRKLLNTESNFFEKSDLKSVKRKSILEVLTSNVSGENEEIDEDFDTEGEIEKVINTMKRNSDICEDAMSHEQGGYGMLNKQLETLHPENVDSINDISFKKDSPSKCKQIHIPAPPRIEEVAELIAAIDDPSDFADIDLFNVLSDVEKTDQLQFSMSDDIYFKKDLSLADLDTDRGLHAESHKETNAPIVKAENFKKFGDHYKKQNLSVTITQPPDGESTLMEFLQEEDSPQLLNGSKDEKEPLKSPSFKSHVKSKILTTPDRFLDHSNQLSINQKRHAEADMPSQCSPHLQGNKVNRKQHFGTDAIETSYSETRKGSLKSMSMGDTLDALLQEVDVHFQTPSSDRNHVDTNDICSPPGNRSIPSTSFATFTQALACLHSSSSENTQCEEEEEKQTDTHMKTHMHRMVENSLISMKDISHTSKEISFRNKAISSSPTSLAEKDSSGKGNVICKGASLEGTSNLFGNNENDRDVNNFSQRCSPKHDSQLLQQTSTSDDDLFLPQFELGFDFDTDIIPSTPEEHRVTVKPFIPERLKSHDVVHRKRKSCHVSPNDQSVKESSSIQADSKKAENMNMRTTISMDESDLSLFEEVQNIEAMNINVLAKNVLDQPVKSPVDTIYPADGFDSFKSEDYIQVNELYGESDTNALLNQTASSLKKNKLPFSSYSVSKTNGNQQETSHNVSVLTEMNDIIFENREESKSNLTEPQSAVKKKKLSLKKSSSKEDIVESNVNTSLNCLNKVSDKIRDECVGRQNSEIERNISTPIKKDFYDAAQFGTSTRVEHLTPIRTITITIQEDIDSEESFLGRRKRKGGAILDQTSDCGSGTELSFWKGNASKMKQNACTIPEKKKTQANAFIISDEEDDFQDPSVKHNTSNVSLQINKVYKSKRPHKKSSKKIFIDDEAVESDENASSDEVEDGDDCYEGSFIDSRMEMTQTQGTDMRAIYLKSVKSPPLGCGKAKYRLQVNQINEDIYSQALPEDQGESEYEEDSFCVGSGEEEEMDWNSDVSSSPVRGRKKKAPKKALKGKKRLRVLTVSSSDEEDPAPMKLTQEFSVNHAGDAAKALMTSSEEDPSIIHKSDIHCSLNAKIIGDRSHSDLENAYNVGGSIAPSQQGGDNGEKMLPVPESIPGGDFDLLDMDDWLNDVNAEEDDGGPNVVETKSPAMHQVIERFSDSNKLVKESNKTFYNKGNSCSGDGKKSSLARSMEESNDTVFHPSQSFSHNEAIVNPIILGASASALPPEDKSNEALSSSNTQRAPLSRCERLKRQKEKQERYQQKLAQVQQQTSLADDHSKDETSSLSSHSLSGSKEIISALRLKHKVTVTAKQLSSCDYVVSNCMAVDRLQWSEFGNSSNRTKLSNRLCEMQAQYLKCVIVIEADKVKMRQEKSVRPPHHTKYMDKTLSFIIQTGIKIYFTNNAEQTAALLFELCEIEKRKGRSFTAPTNLNSKKEEMLNFVGSFPYVTMAEGLNLVHRFKSIAEMVSSPARLIEERGQMSSKKAQWIYSFLRHHFDLQMTPASSR